MDQKLNKLDPETALPFVTGTSFDLTIGIRLSEDVMEDIFITALDGGSNYWADFVFHKIVQKKGSDKVDIKRTLKKYGIKICDIEADTEDGEDSENCRNFVDSANVPRISKDDLKPNDRIIFDWEDWAEGFRLYAESDHPNSRELMIRLMQYGAEEADAEDADMILQFAMFGEIIFI